MRAKNECAQASPRRTIRGGLREENDVFVLNIPRCFPRLVLFPYRFEVPLHAVRPDCKDVREAQVLGVFFLRLISDCISV
jgi:hypothetical protein